MRNRVLIVEDDVDLADLIRVSLVELGIDITLCSNGNDGISTALNEEHDLLVLDITLPDVSGLDICREVRTRKPKQSIMMLTSKNSETDRVLGLELGADDYMTKPFSIRELQARVRAQLRKVEAFRKFESNEKKECQIKLGDLYISDKHHTVELGGKPLDLTSTEFDLIHHFAKHPNQVFSRTQLLESVWGYQHSGYEHTVNSHINRLRTKIEKNAASPKIIQTVWGVGYRLNPHGVGAQ